MPGHTVGRTNNMENAKPKLIQVAFGKSDTQQYTIVRPEPFGFDSSTTSTTILIFHTVASTNVSFYLVVFFVHFLCHFVCIFLVGMLLKILLLHQCGAISRTYSLVLMVTCGFSVTVFYCCSRNRVHKNIEPKLLLKLEKFSMYEPLYKCM